jgi:CarD family transcriptional regulator
MTLAVGAKVIYPNQGLCLIDSIVQKEIGGQSINFYQLALLDESGGELFVPVEKAQASGLRQVLSEAELQQLLNRFKQPTSAAKDWKQRANENSKRLASGSAFDLAEVVESLTVLSHTKELSFREGQMLEKARKLLVSEIAEVISKPKSAAEELINEALQKRSVVSA